MNANFYSQINDNIFLDNTYNKNYDSISKTNSYQNSTETNLSLNYNSNYICQKISLNDNKDKKNSASFSLNIVNEQNQINLSHNNKYVQNIILHSINTKKNSKSFKNNENESINRNNCIQHIKLKTLKKNKENNFKKFEEEIKQNYNNNIIFDTNNTIRVIISNEKNMKNFPLEYINEMICDLCNNLYITKYNLDKIRIIKNQTYIDNQTYLENRMTLFKVIFCLTMNSTISDSTLFLTFDIFDRYISLQTLNIDELLIILITSFSMAIKYSESTVPNLEQLCTVCGNKFNKEQINKCELNIMEKLNFNISIPTIFDLFQFIKVLKNMKSKEYYLGLFILEMFVISGGVLRYNALIVIEAIYLIVLETNGRQMRNLNLYNYMPKTNINTNKYNEEINNCFLNIKEECLHIKEKNFTYLIKKFSSEKYEKISIDFQLL